MAIKFLFHLENLWALDIGYTQHVIYQKEDFVTFKPYTSSLIIGIGKIKIQFSSQRTVKLTYNIQSCQMIILFSDTLYYPIIGINLIFISKLLPKYNVNITFHRTYIKIHALG